jgi:hypothetical protein
LDRSDLDSNLIKHATDVEAVLEFEMVTASKEIAAFELSNNKIATNTNLTEIMNVSF